MALLGKNVRKVSNGHIFEKIEDTIFGGRSGRLNKKNSLVGCDYMYRYTDVDCDHHFDNDSEIGISKQYCLFHDPYNNDSCKNIDNKKERMEKNVIYEDLQNAIKYRRKLMFGG